VLAGAEFGDEPGLGLFSLGSVATVTLFWRLRPVMGSRPA
jgi:hypothetical protein